MVGNTATETTLSALYSLSEIQAPSGILRTFYVDSFRGSDSNDGSLGSPWQTLPKAEANAMPHTRIRLSGVFSPLVINQNADAGACLFGEPASWATGAVGTGTIVGVDEPTGKIALEKLTGANPVATSVITGGTSGCTRTVATITDTLVDGLNSLVMACERGSDACVIIEGWSGGGPKTATINCNNTNASSAGAAIRACGTAACSSAGGSVGWLVVQNVVQEACDTDNFKQVGDGKLLTLNTGVTRNINVALVQNQCYIAAHTGTAIVLNGYCTAHECPSGVLCETAEAVNQSNLAIISNKKFSFTSSGTGTAAAIELSGKHHFIIGPTVEQSTHAGYAVDFRELVDASETLTFRGARINATGGLAALGLRGDRAGTTMTAEIRQTSLTDTVTNGIDINFTATFPDNGFNLTGSCFAIDNIPTQILSVPNQDSIDGVGTFLLTDSLFDDNDVIADWQIGATAYDTLATAQAAAPVDWNLFTGANVEPAVNTTTFWQNTGATVTLGDHSCHKDQTCWRTCGTGYTMAMQSALYIPAFVLGREVQAFTLGGTDSNMGAR
jgi:hypothetical protein